MINGALNTGDYNHALELTHKVLSLLPVSSLNPGDPNFNTYFFLMSLIHIQILFNVGALMDSLDVGYKVLNMVNMGSLAALKPDYFTEEDFKALIADSVGYVALGNVLILSGNVGQFLDIVNADLNFIPKSYNLFIALEDLIHGRPISVKCEDVAENDRFGNIIINIINAFLNYEGDYTKFAEYIYKAKIAAKISKIHQLELFCDLLIGYAYMQLGSYKKADSIIYKIIKATNNNGMTTLLYVAWYIMSELHLKQNKYEVAYGIINNSLIQLEKNNITSEYLLMLFKYNMYKVMMFEKRSDKAEILMAHARYIAAKYGINFNFDTDPNHYIAVEEDDSQSIEDNPAEAKVVSDDELKQGE